MFALTSKPILCPSIRDCAGSPNNRALKFPTVSATNTSAQPICERLVSVPGRYRFVHFFTMPSAPTPLHCDLGPHCAAVSRISLHIFEKWASTKIRFTIGTYGNVAVLRYTLCIQYLSVMCHQSSVRGLEPCRFSTRAWRKLVFSIWWYKIFKS